MLWVVNSAHPPKSYYAATSSANSPSINFLFSRTSNISWWPFNFFYVLVASTVRLKTMVRVAILEPQPFVFVVLSLTVVKVDSIVSFFTHIVPVFH